MIKHVNVTQSLVMMTAQSKFVLMTATKTEYACRNLSREFANVTKDTMVQIVHSNVTKIAPIEGHVSEEFAFVKKGLAEKHVKEIRLVKKTVMDMANV